MVFDGCNTARVVGNIFQIDLAIGQAQQLYQTTQRLNILALFAIRLPLFDTRLHLLVNYWL